MFYGPQLQNKVILSYVKGELSDADAAEMEELKTQGALQFINFRSLNRFSHFRSKKVRDATHDAKQKIDQYHLQLQNLLYEINHLQKEITKCLQFKSNDEDVNLVTVEDFYKEAPGEISKPDVTKKDLHQQTLARLDWELQQRKQLSEKLKEKQKAQDEIKAEIQIKEDFLDSLQPKLNTILESTKPVQEYLGMPFDEIREQHRSAAYLPRPLYVLFMQASAFRDACDKNVHVAIDGDLDDAKNYEQRERADKNKIEEDSESDQEDQEKEQDKKHHRRGSRAAESSSSSKQVSNKEKVLKKHPLTVDLTINLKDSGASLQMSFHYRIMLEIVTLTVKIQVPETKKSKHNSVTGGDLLLPESLLNCLYPDDFGNDTPNQSNKYALQRYSMGEFSDYVNEVGRPYHWVQWLCGLQFLNTSAGGVVDGKAQPAVSATHMEDTIKRLRRRLRARLALQQQLASLEKCNVPISGDFIAMFPAKISSALSSWKRSTYEDFVVLPYCQSIHQSEVVHPTDMYFTAILTRGSAKLTCQIMVPSEYPASPPLFALSMLWKSERTNLNDPNIRDLEAEVNVHFNELLKDKCHEQLLTNQMQRLLMCMDVYLETEGATLDQGPAEFARDKIYPRMFKGPNRSKPYCYNALLGFFGQR